MSTTGKSVVVIGGVGEFGVCQDRDMGVDFSELEVAFVANLVEPNKFLIVIKS